MEVLRARSGNETLDPVAQVTTSFQFSINARLRLPLNASMCFKARLAKDESV